MRSGNPFNDTYTDTDFAYSIADSVLEMRHFLEDGEALEPDASW